ncbi:MAG: class II aldolase/adducin family protein [Spirochaetes bacterium]|nr:class II aldolase/adducin family protein [Spirochaetota bacterium]
MAADSAPADGVIKFRIAGRTELPELAELLWAELDLWRGRLWQLGLIGHNAELNVGFGNISLRLDHSSFVISGTQTGHKPSLGGQDYVIVEQCNFAANSVSCRGPCLPSSEALSHGALYRQPAFNAVVHVHNRRLWDYLRAKCSAAPAAPAAGNAATVDQAAVGADRCSSVRCAATPEPIPYGSRQLYEALGELALAGLDPVSLPQRGLTPQSLLVVTLGHEDGVFAAAASLAEACQLILDINKELV